MLSLTPLESAKVKLREGIPFPGASRIPQALEHVKTCKWADIFRRDRASAEGLGDPYVRSAPLGIAESAEKYCSVGGQ
jgi:hypothetical protein